MVHAITEQDRNRMACRLIESGVNTWAGFASLYVTSLERVFPIYEWMLFISLTHKARPLPGNVTGAQVPKPEGLKTFWTKWIKVPGFGTIIDRQGMGSGCPQVLLSFSLYCTSLLTGQMKANHTAHNEVHALKENRNRPLPPGKPHCQRRLSRNQD